MAFSLILELNTNSWLKKIRHKMWLLATFLTWPSSFCLVLLTTLQLHWPDSSSSMSILFLLHGLDVSWDIVLPDLDTAGSFSSPRFQRGLSQSSYLKTLLHFSHFHFLHFSIQLVIFLLTHYLLPSLDFISLVHSCFPLSGAVSFIH